MPRRASQEGLAVLLLVVSAGMLCRRRHEGTCHQSGHREVSSGFWHCPQSCAKLRRLCGFFWGPEAALRECHPSSGLQIENGVAIRITPAAQPMPPMGAPPVLGMPGMPAMMLPPGVRPPPPRPPPGPPPADASKASIPGLASAGGQICELQGYGIWQWQ